MHEINCCNKEKTGSGIEILLYGYAMKMNDKLFSEKVVWNFNWY